MARAARDISASEALHHLTSLYNDIGLGSVTYSPDEICRKQEIVLHLIATLQVEAGERPPPRADQPSGQVLEFRPR